MRLPFALAAATAYALGRTQSATAAPGAASEPAIVEPWFPPAMSPEPDPIAAFMFDALKAVPGARTPVIAVLDAYEAWATGRARRPAERDAALDRLRHYGTVQDVPGLGPCLVGLELYAFAAFHTRLVGPHTLRPTPLRAIPGLRARVLADAALLSAELLAVLQAVRDVLEAATDLPGVAGDVVRLSAAMLDDALADAAAGTSERPTA